MNTIDNKNGRIRDLSNQRFGKLTTTNEYDIRRCSNNIRVYWKCVCDCGNTLFVRNDRLISGRTKTCGCISPVYKHGLTHHPLYHIWSGMRIRCYSETSDVYKWYGGRGIKICDEWQDFQNFYDWGIANGYEKGLSIERKNVNGNYEPSNCCWIPLKEQGKNKTNTRYLTFYGETHSLSEWSRITGIGISTIRERLKRNWKMEDVLSCKPFKRGKRYDTKTYKKSAVRGYTKKLSNGKIIQVKGHDREYNKGVKVV